MLHTTHADENRGERRQFRGRSPVSKISDLKLDVRHETSLMVCRRILRRCTVGLLVAALTLPVIITVFLGLGRLLGVMGDEVGHLVLDRLAIGFGVLWVLSLVALLLIQTFSNLLSPPESDESSHLDDEPL